MDKISGIVPASPRVMSVEMKESSPVRPGTPSFGRPEGVSSLKEAAQLATAPKSAAIQSQQMDWRSKDAAHAAVVSQLADSFFARTPKTPETAPMRETERSSAPRPMMAREVSSSPAGFKTDEFGSLRAATPRSMAAAAMEAEFDNDPTTELKQPEGLFPKGSFIDRTA